MYYGILERQFRRYVDEAFRTARNPGEVLVTNLERRLDNLVYRLGFATTLRQARQVVVHGHIAVNNQKVDRPSYRVNVGDNISLRTKGQQIQMLVDNFTDTDIEVPYLNKDREHLSGQLTKLPLAHEVPIDVKIAKVLEFYSRR
jgi:small subunit ribosomal protein S4